MGNGRGTGANSSANNGASFSNGNMAGAWHLSWPAEADWHAGSDGPRMLDHWAMLGG